VRRLARLRPGSRGRGRQNRVGRELAGKLLRLERLRDGRLLLTPVVDVPESQLWTLAEPHKSRIERGLAWAKRTPTKETNVAALVSRAKRRKKRYASVRRSGRLRTAPATSCG